MPGEHDSYRPLRSHRLTDSKISFFFLPNHPKQDSSSFLWRQAERDKCTEVLTNLRKEGHVLQAQSCCQCFLHPAAQRLTWSLHHTEERSIPWATEVVCHTAQSGGGGGWAGWSLLGASWYCALKNLIYSNIHDCSSSIISGSDFPFIGSHIAPLSPL